MALEQPQEIVRMDLASVARWTLEGLASHQVPIAEA
jgi:hypothetical protein